MSRYLLVLLGVCLCGGMLLLTVNQASAAPAFRDCPECPDMVWLPPGVFRMGSLESEPDRWADEGPLRTVTFSQRFAMGRTPVTQAQWRAIMGDNPAYFADCDDCPVERITWRDAQAFIERLQQRTGQSYRLPSEAEWEYACRAGERQRYCGSDDVDLVAWYNANSRGRPRPVAGKKSNGWGLYDMSGNVWEWTQDCWNDSYRDAPQDGSAWMQGDCNRRVIRGGAWSTSPSGVRSAFRGWISLTYRLNNQGLRVVRSP